MKKKRAAIWQWVAEKKYHKDLVLLLAALVIVGGTSAFIFLANEVRSGSTISFDERILKALRNPANLNDPVGPRWVETAVRDATALGSTLIMALLSLFSIGFLLLRRKIRDAILLSVTLGGGYLLNWGLKWFFARPRPTIVPHLDYVSNASFPSGHALLATTVYCTLGAVLANVVKDRRAKIYIICVALFLSFLVGLSRVYLGVHFPTDVLAGWAIGLVWSILSWLAQRGLKPGVLPGGTSS